MNRSKVLQELDALVFARLFGSRPWLADRETAAALKRKLAQLGLEEQVPGETETWRATPFGKEQRLELLMVFMGLWYELEMPMILEIYGLIDESEYEFIFDLLSVSAAPDSVMQAIVQRAYLEYYNPSHLLN